MKQKEMNPMEWNKEQWKDALLGAVLTVFALSVVFVTSFIH